MKLLVVVDMQKDFVDGALGTAQAQEIVKAVTDRVLKAKEDGYDLIFTMDTHEENYLETQEGKHLPVKHCIRGTEGWKLIPSLRPLTVGSRVIEKPTFGSTKLSYLVSLEDYQEIELIGLCTDICVISNALLLKAAVPETTILVNASCCAGVTVQSHESALQAMKMCQIEIIGSSDNS